ncbi:dihydroxy-acid dehydratase [Acidocella sp.]|uniref:dihydroxy-acid dehydratase domain-containing protein n=1 Tax=Acidocella sp. TaxID=50710 RepID=UPI003D019886
MEKTAGPSIASNVLGRFVHRAHLKQLGGNPASVDKPRIGVVNSSGGMSVCYAHLDEIAKLVSDAVEAAGGYPVEIRTTGPTDGLFFVLGGRDAVPDARDILAHDIEMMAKGEALDGLVLLSSCDSTTPGHLLAVAQLDLPAIIVPCGFQAGGQHCGRNIHIMDLYERTGAFLVGQADEQELEDMADHTIGSPGVCAGLGTANTMHMMAEALGLALPGNAPIWAGSVRLRDFAAKAGEAIVGLVERDLRPSFILTEAAFHNALAVLLVSGGAATAVHHLQALGEACRLGVDVYAMVERLGKSFHQACFISPSGGGNMEELEAMGGVRALMKTLEGRLSLDAVTINGPLRAVLAAAEGADAYIPESSTTAGLVLVRGNLAPGGALVRPGVSVNGARAFEGAAVVVQNPSEAQEAVRQGRVPPGSVLVMIGGIDDTACITTGAALGDKIALVSNGGYSGLSRGLVVGFMPRGDEPGHPIHAVRDGDRIRIDVDACLISWTKAGTNAVDA